LTLNRLFIAPVTEPLLFDARRSTYAAFPRWTTLFCTYLPIPGVHIDSSSIASSTSWSSKSP
jgi:hypothetical protein